MTDANGSTPTMPGSRMGAPDCDTARDRMVEAMENPVAEAEVRAHVRHCVPCARVWRDLHEVADELVRAADSLPGAKTRVATRVPTAAAATDRSGESGLADRVMERIRQESRVVTAGSPDPAAAPRSTTPWPMVAVIVVLSVALVLVLSMRGGTDASTDDGRDPAGDTGAQQVVPTAEDNDGNPNADADPADPQSTPEERIAWHLAQCDAVLAVTVEYLANLRLRDISEFDLGDLLEASTPRTRLLEQLRRLPDEPAGVAEAVRDEARARADAIPRLALKRAGERRYWQGIADYIDYHLPPERRSDR